LARVKASSRESVCPRIIATDRLPFAGISRFLKKPMDDHGQRWIVDYKVGRHSGTDREAFLDREQERYRSQLEHYARLMALWEERPIRLGLYFPLIQGWREWAWSEPAQETGDTRQTPSPAR
ncbi:MAG: hypothetical protein R6Y91_02855, partial [Desulfohalobium sp.]